MHRGIMFGRPAVFFFLLCLAAAGQSGAQEAKPPRHAPDALPGVEPEMLAAGYWISLQPDADTVIMTPEQISRFNTRIRNKKNEKESFEGPLRNPILPLELPDTLPGDSLRVRLENNRDRLLDPGSMYGSRDFYDNRLIVYSRHMKDDLAAKMNLGAIPKNITRRFGIVVNHTNLRQYPTSVPGYHNTTAMLDRFQITDLNIGYPVAVLHESADGDFLFVESPLGLGWVPAGDIALGARAAVREMVTAPAFIMASGERVPVFHDRECRTFARYLYLSETMPLAKGSAGGNVVRMPVRSAAGGLGTTAGYLRPGADVHIGWLPYTKRNVLTQMFKLLDTPYGWHGQDNKRDCVGALRVVFRSMGIETGRAISAASENTVPMDPKLSIAEKLAKVGAIEPVITVVSSPDHTALLLGRGGNGKIYFMHQGGWGYKENGEYLFVNRVSINHAEHPWFSISQPNLYTVMK